MMYFMKIIEDVAIQWFLLVLVLKGMHLEMFIYIYLNVYANIPVYFSMWKYYDLT